MVKTTVWCPNGKQYHIYVDAYGRFNSIWLDTPYNLKEPAMKNSVTRDDISYVYVFPGMDDSYLLAKNERADRCREILKQYFAEVKSVDPFIFRAYMEMFSVKDKEVYNVIKDC